MQEYITKYIYNHMGVRYKLHMQGSHITPRPLLVNFEIQ